MPGNILSLNEGIDLRCILRESCGLSAAVNLPVASQFVFEESALQIHRGEVGGGIVTVKDGRFFTRRRVGSIINQFTDVDFSNRLPGKTAIGHVRYATQGDTHLQNNVQPLVFLDTRFGPLAIAHNGTLMNCAKTKAEMLAQGFMFQSSTDSEIIGHLIGRSSAPTLEEAIVDAIRDIPAAYSLLILSSDKLIALRDPHGVRPLSIARIGEGYLVASENYAFDQYEDAEFIRDVEPGEMIIFEKDKKTFRSRQYAESKEMFCIMEGIYFSIPRTTYNGYYHEDFRQELGKRLFMENPGLTGDFILPILDSGKHAGIGLAKAAGMPLPYKEYLMRVHNTPRTNIRSFTSVTEAERVRTAYQKQHLRKDKIKGRRAVTMDDTVVRSTTMKILNKRLRDAGAKQIINCISAPTIRYPCHGGMDYQETSQLVASNHSIEEIRDIIGADHLIYLSFEGLKKVVSETYRCKICDGCFGGEYPQI